MGLCGSRAVGRRAWLLQPDFRATGRADREADGGQAAAPCSDILPEDGIPKSLNP